jgi:hypothetical protein
MIVFIKFIGLDPIRSKGKIVVLFPVKNDVHRTQTDTIKHMKKVLLYSVLLLPIILCGCAGYEINRLSSDIKDNWCNDTIKMGMFFTNRNFILLSLIHPSQRANNLTRISQVVEPLVRRHQI